MQNAIKIKSTDRSEGVIVLMGNTPEQAIVRFLRVYCAKYSISRERLLNGI